MRQPASKERAHKAQGANDDVKIAADGGFAAYETEDNLMGSTSTSADEIGWVRSSLASNKLRRDAGEWALDGTLLWVCCTVVRIRPKRHGVKTS